jgi:crotonobetaine/carnitine-CoA ligase
VTGTANATRSGLLTGSGADLGPTALRYPVEQRTMLRVLADQAAARPDHPWLIFDSDAVLTFAAAHDLVWRVAASLRASWSRPGHVALMMRNQFEFMPAFYGAMAAGGVTVPLNADARGPLLHTVLEVSDSSVLIVRTDLLDRVQELDDLAGLELIVATGDGPLPDQIAAVPVVRWTEWLVDSAASDPTLPSAFDTALIQFTSGTTGTSKGALYSHHFLYLFCAMITDTQGHAPDAILSTPLPVYHVAALHLVANAALQAGCTAHLKSRFSAGEFFNQIAADRATFTIILGPMAASVDKTCESAPEHWLAGMFCVPPPPGHEEFERKFRVRLLYQGYGSTECYPIPMPTRMRPGLPADTLGMPVSWMEYGVVDDNDQLLPPGVPGELVIRPRLAFGMINGYYREPEATAQVFRNFMFHTGDVAVYDPDGTLHYRGRRQEHIRRRGENVSAPELEQIALSHPLVLEAAAFGVQSALGEHDIKLDVVLTQDLPPAELHGWLRSNLPRYMVPRYIERRDRFPKTPSERIEKYRLVAEGIDRPGIFDSGER